MKKLVSFAALTALLLTLVIPSFAVAADRPARGDVNADSAINMKDVLAMRKFIAGISALNEEAADVNGDSTVNMKDVLLLRKYIAGMAVEFAPYNDTTSAVSPTATTAKTAAPTSGATTAPTQKRTTHKPYEDFSPYYMETTLPDRVTLSYYDANSESLAITWHTTLEVKEPVVQYVKASDVAAADFSKADSKAATTEIFNAKGMPYDPVTNLVLRTNQQGFMTVEDFTHRVVLDTLDYNTTYAYRVGDKSSGVWSDTYTFKTRPETIDEFSFVYISDTQVSNPWEVGSEHYMHDALIGAAEKDPNFSFIINGGDVVETSWHLHLWQTQLNGNKDFLTRYPFMTVSGNHEGQNDGYAPYSIHRHLTTEMPEQNDTLDTGVYYSFNYGNAHFAVLNTCSDGQRSPNLDSAQEAWLEQDLKAAADSKWKIVVMHVPMVGKHETLGSVHRLFLETGVDMVLEADEHMFLRSYPIGERSTTITNYESRTEDGVKYAVNPKGVIYSMYATGGDATQGTTALEKANWLEYYANGKQSTWANISVSADRITVHPYYYSGGVKTYIGNATWGIIKE